MNERKGPNLSDDDHERYDRLRKLPLTEVEHLLDSISATFEEIKDHYPGLGQLPQSVGPDDLHELQNAFGNLLPLSMNDEVQDQITAADPEVDFDSLAWHRIGFLTADILYYLADFTNTGIQRLE